MPPAGNHVADLLAAIVGDRHVLLDDDLRAGHETDWTGRWSARSLAVVRPGTVDEVAAILRLCARDSIAVVPQGGNTGLVGGSVPRAEIPSERQIVLSTQRFDEVGDVDPTSMQLTVGAGVTISRWRDTAHAAGFDAGVDFAARDSATVGGAIATNAGGSRVLRFGTMRRQLAGVEVVLTDGSVVGSLTGLPKETAGLHWPSLVAGSEGTLGIVTRARLHLVPLFEHHATAMVTTATIDDAARLLSRLRTGVASLDAVELILPEALDLVSEHLGTTPPVTARGRECVLVIDAAAHRDPADELLACLDGSGVVRESAIATDPVRHEQLLLFRDRITEAIAEAAGAMGTPVVKLDVAVPVTELGAMLDTARRAADADGCRMIPFGHLAEGNVHLNFLGVTDTERLAATILTDVSERGGTISAEHGIGVAKARWLPLIRGPGDLEAQRRLADALDPARILNPGVLGRHTQPDGRA